MTLNSEVEFAQSPAHDLKKAFDLLFVAYVGTLASIIVTNSRPAAEYVLILTVLPVLAFILLKLQRQYRITAIIGKSVILRCAAVYVLILLLSTYSSRGIEPADPRPFRLYVVWGIELLSFLIATAVLTAFYKGFIRRLLGSISALLALNGIINIWAFLPLIDWRGYNVLSSVFQHRLSAVFGTRDYRNATHVGPLFSQFFVPMLIACMPVASVLQRAVLVTCAIISGIVIVLTQARGSYVVVACGLAVVAVVSRKGRIASLFILLVGACAVFGTDVLRDVLISRGSSFRFDLWHAYIDKATSAPFVGFGLDRYLEISIKGVTFEQPHNSLVWAFVRGGVIALISSSVMVLMSMYASFRHWRTNSDVSPLLIVIGMAITSVTEIGFLIFPFNWLWVVFWLPIGIGAGTELMQIITNQAHRAHILYGK